MKNLIALLALVLCAFTFAPPKIKVVEVSVSPSEMGIGDKALFSVKLKAPDDAVQSVTVITSEAPDYRFYLNDNGENGDAKAGDGTWSFEVTVPGEAQPGPYVLEVKVLDKEGNQVVADGHENQIYGKAGKVTVRIK